MLCSLSVPTKYSKRYYAENREQIKAGMRRYREAHPAPRKAPLSLAERVLRKVNKNGPVPPKHPELGPCWIWKGQMSEGYGMLTIRTATKRIKRSVHRLVWEDAHGPLDRDTTIHHRCEVKSCVNLDHLEALSWTDHARAHHPMPSPKCDGCIALMKRIKKLEKKLEAANAEGPEREVSGPSG